MKDKTIRYIKYTTLFELITLIDRHKAYTECLKDLDEFYEKHKRCFTIGLSQEFYLFKEKIRQDKVKLEQKIIIEKVEEKDIKPDIDNSSTSIPRIFE